ncbi:MAG: hypothetical protein Q9174_006573 [Haloplaca sp. 1 TL-2023]
MTSDTSSDSSTNSSNNVKPNAKPNKASVLLISWTDDRSESAEYHRQVDALRVTFEDAFGFHTTSVSLDSKTSLELQVLSKVSTFAAAYDRAGDLLIVYYAGRIDVGDYCFKKELYGRKKARGETVRNRIVWAECEKALRMTHSHVFWIFDWSDLSTLHSNYEQLCLVRHQTYTRNDINCLVIDLGTPPVQSFTPALDKVLLVAAEKTRQGKTFTTLDLLELVKAELHTDPETVQSLRLRDETDGYPEPIGGHIMLQPFSTARVPNSG